VTTRWRTVSKRGASPAARRGAQARENGEVLRASRSLALAAVAAALAGASASAASASAPACGAASRAVAAAVDGVVASRIYDNELDGSEVHADVGHVTSAPDLLAAVAADHHRAALAAVTRIVYHLYWHIVRLRVLDRAGHVLADVGGPYVIAPVRGLLRSRGAVIGSFVMSVQDDTGVTKLESRFVGAPIGMYVAGRLVASLGAALPVAMPAGATLALGGVDYAIVRQRDLAFPSGTVTAVVLVPPAGALAAQPCTAVRAAAYGNVAQRLAALASDLPVHYPQYAATVTIYSGALVFVRAGARQLASSGGAGPTAIPSAGTVSYEGRSWLVYSFVAAAPARIYVLSPAT
jgi:hypothetical protein